MISLSLTKKYASVAVWAALFLIALSCMDGFASAQTSAPEAWRGNPDLMPLRDLVVIWFDRDLDALRQEYSFGVFRDDKQPPEVQWIEESRQVVLLPGRNKPFSFLNLHYEVPGVDSYNGWWLKLKNADWNQYRQWDLVLRLRLGQASTTRFKVELKAAQKNSKQVSVFPAAVNLSAAHLAALTAKGFCDVVIPLRLMVSQADLSQMQEFVIVFENNRVDVKKGDLQIHSIRLACPETKEANMALDALLDQLARTSFLWFEDHRSAKTGLILDRGRNSPTRGAPSNVSSIASVGYYLSMLPEAERTGQIRKELAQERILTVLNFASTTMQNRHGLFHHFIDGDTGQPLQDSEISCLDSAIFFNGCMVVAQAYGGRIAELANKLIDQADWTQFLVEHPKTFAKVLSLGWKDRTGLLGAMDVRSSEMALAYFLAIGSRSHPIDPQCWYNTLIVFGEVEGHKVLNPHLPLFTSYYGLGWHALKGLADKDGIALEANAREAALANRAFCRTLAQSCPTYKEEYGGWWGISAGDSPTGYVAPQLIPGDAAGTVWPTAALAAVPWAFDEIRADLDNWRKSSLWPIVCGTYGLAPFNLEAEWIGSDVIGIDLGSFYLNLANQRNVTVQQLWMKHPVAKAALERLEFRAAPK